MKANSLQLHLRCTLLNRNPSQRRRAVVVSPTDDPLPLPFTSSPSNILLCPPLPSLLRALLPSSIFLHSSLPLASAACASSQALAAQATSFAMSAAMPSPLSSDRYSVCHYVEPRRSSTTTIPIRTTPRQTLPDRQPLSTTTHNPVSLVRITSAHGHLSLVENETGHSLLALKGPPLLQSQRVLYVLQRYFRCN